MFLVVDDEPMVRNVLGRFEVFRRLGGRISVDSGAARGARFAVIVPAGR